MTKTFEEMTRAERKIEICKDVLKHIGIIRATPGTYLRGGLAPEIDGIIPSDGRLYKRCDVCALGALLIGRINRFNTLKWSDISIRGELRLGSDNIIVLLESVFDEEELCDIEAAFEGWDKYDEIFESDPQERLRIIMQHIIDNNGILNAEILISESNNSYV